MVEQNFSFTLNKINKSVGERQELGTNQWSAVLQSYSPNLQRCETGDLIVVYLYGILVF